MGTWLGARLATRFADPRAMLAVAVLIGLGAGLGTLWLWVRLMRRLPHVLSRRMAPRRSREVNVASTE
jgi:phosphate/sulfate permease